MVSFRFHLVSLTAVFLALALGIAMGATVVDRATVDLLQSRLNKVEANSNKTNRDNNQLRDELSRWNQFSDQAGDRLVRGRLTNARIVMLAIEGIDRGPVDALRNSLTAAGADVAATVWVTAKMALKDAGDVTSLRQVTDAAAANVADLRRIVGAEVATAVTLATATGPLADLVARGFARVDGPAGAPPVDITTLPADGVRYVVVSDPKAAAPNNELAQPLVEELVRRAPLRVLAAEAGHDAPGQRAVFVGPLRSANNNQLSTVDDLDQFAGRVAAVLALVQLGQGQAGDFGVGPGASRLLPDVPS
jgi:copper transport outer membrane protein MctB